MTLTIDRNGSYVAWMCRIVAFAICAATALNMWLGLPGAKRFSWVLGVPVEVARGETNQYLVRAAPRSVDFTRIGKVDQDLGYSVGVTLLDGTQIGFRYQPPEPTRAVAATGRLTTVLLGAGALYTLLHFVLFATILRYKRAFRAERNIFLFHLLSATAVTIIAAAIVARDSAALAGAIGMVSIHGIYSLSFLELWSLAEGGYSLAILRDASGGGDSTKADEDSMNPLGARKVQLRVGSLARLRLANVKDDRLELTRSGHVVASVEQALRLLANSRVDT